MPAHQQPQAYSSAIPAQPPESVHLHTADTLPFMATPNSNLSSFIWSIACPCCDGALRLAGKPAQIIPKGLLSESALAWIATSKFDDGGCGANKLRPSASKTDGLQRQPDSP